MSLKFNLFSFLSQNTLSRKHDVGVLFTWARSVDRFLRIPAFFADTDKIRIPYFDDLWILGHSISTGDSICILALGSGECLLYSSNRVRTAPPVS